MFLENAYHLNLIIILIRLILRRNLTINENLICKRNLPNVKPIHMKILFKKYLNFFDKTLSTFYYVLQLNC